MRHSWLAGLPGRLASCLAGKAGQLAWPGFVGKHPNLTHTMVWRFKRGPAAPVEFAALVVLAALAALAAGRGGRQA